MDWQIWQFIITLVFTLVNSIVLISTLVILIKQTRIFRNQTEILQKQTKEALDASSSVSLTQLWEMEFKVDDMFLQKPHLRKYFYKGASIDESDPLYEEVEAAAEKLLDVIEHLLWQAKLFPKLYVHDDPDGNIKWDIWHNYIIDLFISSPLLIAYAEKRRTWYTPPVIDSLEKAQNILNQKKNTSSS